MIRGCGDISLGEGGVVRMRDWKEERKTVKAERSDEYKRVRKYLCVFKVCGGGRWRRWWCVIGGAGFWLWWVEERGRGGRGVTTNRDGEAALIGFLPTSSLSSLMKIN